MHLYAILYYVFSSTNAYFWLLPAYQTWTVLSLLAEAIYAPSGDQATEVTQNEDKRDIFYMATSDGHACILA